MFVRLFLGIVLFALAIPTWSCSDDPLTVVQPRIEVDPTSIDFGEGIVGAENGMWLMILNRGEGELVIDRVSFDPDDGIFGAKDIPERVRPIVDEQRLRAIFIPAAPKVLYSGTMIIHSNDPANPALEVPLMGVGGVHEIDVTPVEIDFGVVNEGTAPRRAIRIENVGKDKLEIMSVTFTSTSADLALAPDTFVGGTIPALTSTVVEVVYAPVDLGADQATVTIQSNDEDEPMIVVPIRGRANLAPRAIAWACDRIPGQIGCDGQPTFRDLTAGLRRSVAVDGRESTDPEGGRIDSFRWVNVEKPQGAAGIFQSTDDLSLRRGATGDVQVDRVGRYDFRLIVRDERGLDSLDRPESHITIRPKDIEVRLRWDVGTDVDIHLVRPQGMVGDYGTGAIGTSTGSDCTSFNRAPNWNDILTPIDDPSLDRDVVSGEGPEVISIDSPEDGAPYTAYAHYCDSRNVGVNVHATFDVYVKGVLVATIPEIGGYRLVPGELWAGAVLVWDESTQNVMITEGMDPPVMRPSLCRSE